MQIIKSLLFYYFHSIPYLGTLHLSLPYTLVQNSGIIILYTRVVFNARDGSNAGGGKGRSQNPDLMNKKSLWLKGDWFVSSWVAFYSALERRGVLIDTPPPPNLPPSLPGACDLRVIKYNARHLKFGNPGIEKRRSEFVFTAGVYRNDYSEAVC